jgi:TPR repeat protein
LYFITGDKKHALDDYRMACSLGNGRACEVFSALSRELQGR